MFIFSTEIYLNTQVIIFLYFGAIIVIKYHWVPNEVLEGSESVNDQVNLSDYLGFIFEYLIMFCASFAYIKNITNTLLEAFSVLLDDSLNLLLWVWRLLECYVLQQYFLPLVLLL